MRREGNYDSDCYAYQIIILFAQLPLCAENIMLHSLSRELVSLSTDIVLHDIDYIV